VKAAEQAKVQAFAKETLMEDHHFKFKQDLKSEVTDCSYLANLNSPEWQEPRLYTLQQLRDTFYAMLHQSHLKV
jgi:hypothetical protein